jgi:hypothetical protein
LRIYNRNEKDPLTDLNVYDFDVKFTGKTVDAGERALGNCRKDLKESEKYVCPFQIGPVIKLPYEVTAERDEYDPISLGSLNVTVYMKYAGNLITDTKSILDGTVTIYPKKPISMVNSEKMVKQLQRSFNETKVIFKVIIFLLSLCTVCIAGNKIVDVLISSEPSGYCTQDNQCKADETCDVASKTCIKKEAKQIIKEHDAKAEKTKKKCEACFDSGKYAFCVDQKCYDKIPPPGLVCTWKREFCDSPSLIPTVGSGTVTSGEESAKDSIGLLTKLVLAVLTLYGLIELWNIEFGKGEGKEIDVEEQKSEMKKLIEYGIKVGFTTCVLPRVLGEIGLGKVFTKIGTGVGDLCELGMRFTPLILTYIKLQIAFMHYEMCIKMVEAQLEASSAVAGAEGGFYKNQVQAQASLNTMTQMMNCYNQLMQPLSEITRDINYISYIIKSIQTATVFRYNNVKISANSRLSGTGIFEVYVKNICNGGIGQAKIEIIGNDAQGKTCSRSDSIQCLQMDYMPSMYSYMYYQQQTGSLSSYINTNNCETGEIKVIITMGSGKTETYKFYYEKTGST